MTIPIGPHVELRHMDKIPHNEGSDCYFCPRHRLLDCTYKPNSPPPCSARARAAKLRNPGEYYFFDPVIYGTWRLTGERHDN